MSNILPAGTPAPDFTLHAKPDQTLTLKGLRGRPVILAFYPAGVWGPDGALQRKFSVTRP